MAGKTELPTIFLYFMSEREFPLGELGDFLSKSKALILERAQSDGVDTVEERLNQVLKGKVTPYSFCLAHGVLNQPDIMEICELIYCHPFLEHVYYERSPFTRATDPWENLVKAEINSNLPVDDQLRQLRDILGQQADLHKKRDSALARLIEEISEKHAGNVTVVRGRGHVRSLQKACKDKNLSCQAFEAPLQGHQSLQEKLIVKMAANDQPTPDELKAALTERFRQGGAK